MNSLTRSIALLRAVERGDLAEVTRLLADRADPNGVNPQGSTLLMVAALGTNGAIVRALVAAGADVNRQAIDGSTALMKAALWGNTEIVKALLELGADPELTDAEGWTAAQIARAGGHDEIARLLTEHRAADRALARDPGSTGPSPRGGAPGRGRTQ